MNLQAELDAVHARPRRQILELLAAGERSVTDIAKTLNLKQSVASKHLRALREAGIVKVDVEGRYRRYALRAEPLPALAIWLTRLRQTSEPTVEA